MTSEKAYTPETARHISNLHLTIETLSLALFAFQHYQILFLVRDESDWYFSNSNCSRMATAGPTIPDFILGWSYFMVAGLHWFGWYCHFRNA